MSWLNLNQSFNSIKGQLTTLATELTESIVEDSSTIAPQVEVSNVNSDRVNELESKLKDQELQISALVKLNEELETTLQCLKEPKNVESTKDEEISWSWDQPENQSNDDSSKTRAEKENADLRSQLQTLQDEISNIKKQTECNSQEQCSVNLTVVSKENLEIQPAAGFASTSEEVICLREENEKLNSNLEDLDNQHQLAMDRLLNLKKDLQRNFEVLKQEHSDLKTANEKYCYEIQSLNTEMQSRANENAKVIENMLADYDTLHHKYDNLEKVYRILREDAEKFQEDNQQLHEENFKLQEEISLHESDTKNAEPTDLIPKRTYDELLLELKGIQSEESPNETDEFIDSNIDDNAKSIIENLKREIFDLRSKLVNKESFEHSLVASSVNTIEETHLINLLDKYVTFDLPDDFVGDRSTPTVLRRIEKAFETFANYNKDVDKHQKEIFEKNLNISTLHTQIEDITAENDFLTTDLANCESELSEMKKNNDFLINEIAALKNASKLEPIIETHEENFAKLESELAVSTQMNQNFENEIKKAENELGEVKKDRDSLKEELRFLREQYQKIDEGLEEYKNKVEDLEIIMNGHNRDVADDITTLECNQREVRISQSEKTTQHSDSKDTEHKQDYQESKQQDVSTHNVEQVLKDHELESKCHEIVQQNESLVSRCSSLTQKLGLLTMTSENVTGEKGEAQIPVLKLHKKTEAELRSVTKNMVNILKKIYNLNQNADKLSDEELELSEKIQNLCVQIDDSRKLEFETKVEDLENKVMEHANCISRIEQLSVENETISREKNRLIEDFDVVREKILECVEIMNFEGSGECDVLELCDIAYESAIAVKYLTDKLYKLQLIIANKNEDFFKLKVAKDEIQAKCIGSEDCNKTQIAVKQKNIDDLIVQNEELAVRLSETSTKFNETIQKVDELEKAFDDMKNLYDTSTLTKKKQLNGLQNDLEKLRSENVGLVKELMEAKETITQFDIKDNPDEEIVKSKMVTEDLQMKITEYEKLLNAANEKVALAEKRQDENMSAFDKLQAEKTELINLITLKHNENIQYHTEIQRLNAVLLEQNDRYSTMVEEHKNCSQKLKNMSCENCTKLQEKLFENEKVMESLNEMINTNKASSSEFDDAKETIRVLSQKCENLDKNLTIQLDSVKQLMTEKIQLSEREQNTVRELERLRSHLVEIEDTYTQELMLAEQKLTEYQTKLAVLEDRAKQTSTVYTSNSIRANQEVETLRAQCTVLERERSCLQSKMAARDDEIARAQTSARNLQAVLEQFQLDKEQEVYSSTEKIRRQMDTLKIVNNALQAEVSAINNKLQESNNGLIAASRLGEQLEAKTAQLNDMKTQVSELETALKIAEAKYKEALINRADRVDKPLVKNLVLGYLQAAQHNKNNDRSQVLRILSSVLDFNQTECEKIGLGSRSENATSDSLATEFIRFLEKESSRPAPLPSMMDITQNNSTALNSRSTTPRSRNSSVIGPAPNITPTPSHQRNASTGSNNLLFQNVEPQNDSTNLGSRKTSANDFNPEILTSNPLLGSSSYFYPISAPETGVTQTRNTEGAILKSVLKDS